MKTPKTAAIVLFRQAMIITGHQRHGALGARVIKNQVDNRDMKEPLLKWFRTCYTRWQSEAKNIWSVKYFSGAETFAILRSVIDTAVKNNLNPLQSLSQINALNL